MTGEASLTLREFACRLAFQCAAWETAEHWLEALVSVREDDAPAWFNLAVARVQRGRYPEAIDAVRCSLALRPGHAGAERLLADARRCSGGQADG